MFVLIGMCLDLKLLFVFGAVSGRINYHPDMLSKCNTMLMAALHVCGCNGVGVFLDEQRVRSYRCVLKFETVIRVRCSKRL